MKKLLSVFITCFMLVCMIPANVFAADFTVSTAADLATAITTASAGDTIKLAGDITVDLNTTYEINKEMTLDLNGHQLVSRGDDVISGWYSFIHIVKGGNLTVTDTSTDKNGRIMTVLPAGNYGWTGKVTVWVEGELTLENGTIQMDTNDAESILPFAIDVRPNVWGSDGNYTTKFTMNGGKVIINDAEDAIRLAVYSGSNNTEAMAECVINDGEISGGYCIMMQQANKSYRPVKLTVNGGTLTGVNAAIRTFVENYESYGGPEGTKAFDVTINGGKLTATDTGSNYGVVAFSDSLIPEETKKVSVAGGTFTGGNTEKTNAFLANYTAENYGYVFSNGNFVVKANNESIASFTLTKDFNIAAGYENAGNPVADPASKFNANPVFTIAEYISSNRETGQTTIPAFIGPNYTVNVSGGENTVDIALPDYTGAGAGDYWYTVTEQANSIAGITNDEKATRYLHVQVIRVNGAAQVASVSLHSKDPQDTSETESDVKTTGFANTYGAGQLAVNKVVDGNMGDAEKLFKVTVTFTAPAGKTVMSDIAYTGGFDNAGNALDGTIAAETGWTTKTFEFNLKNGSTITFTNIPDGVTYAVAEDNYSDDGYETAYSGEKTEEGDTPASGAGLISDDLDKVTITNTKNVPIDVGVILDNTPFAILLIGSMAYFAIHFVNKNRREDY